MVADAAARPGRWRLPGPPRRRVRHASFTAATGSSSSCACSSRPTIRSRSSSSALTNRLDRPRRVTVTYYVEWVLGATRDAIAGVRRPGVRPRVGSAARAQPVERGLRRPRRVRRGEREAARTHGRPRGVPRPARQLRGPGGAAAASGSRARSGAGLDPCAALQLHLDLAPGATARVHFMLGQAAGRDEALGLVTKYRDRAHRRGGVGRSASALGRAARRGHRAHAGSGARSDAQPLAPLPGAVAAGSGAGPGTTSPSGAFGFRDQLQDVAALVHCAPTICRGPYPRGGAPPVRGGRRPALVASAGGSRGANAVLGRSPVAARSSRRTTSRRPATRRSCPRRCRSWRASRSSRDEVERYARFEPGERARDALRALPGGDRARPHGRARTGCRCSAAATGTTG